MQRTPPADRRQPTAAAATDVTVGSNRGITPLSHRDNPVMASPLEHALNEAKVAVMAATAAWEDDYQDLNLNEVPVCLLKDQIKELETLKKALQANEPRLQLAGPPAYPAELKESVNRARKGYSALIRSMMKALAAYEELNRTAAPPATPGATAGGSASLEPPPPASMAVAKLPIVRQDLTLVTAQIESMLTAISEINAEPDSEREYRVFTTKCSSAFQQVENIKTFASSVINEAALCGLVTEMTALNGRLTALRTAEDGLRTADRGAKTRFGAVSDQGREYILTPPKFCGDSDKGLDFFSFKRDWLDFKRQAHASESKLLRILLSESLSGVAKSTCRDLDSEAKVFAKLDKMFGNISFLISAKIDEIQRLRKCEGTKIKQREWCIEVSTKLSALEKLAIKHNKEDKLYHSVITDHVTQALPQKWQEGFLSFAQRKHGFKDSDEDSSGDENDYSGLNDLSMKSVYETLVKYLQNKIRRLTFDIDYSLSVQKTRDEKPKPAAERKMPPSRPAAAYVFTEGSEPQTSQVAPAPTEAVTKPQKEKSGKKAEKKAPQQQPPQQRPPQQTPQQQLPIIASNYTVPATVKCKWCNGSHTHAFYCGVFQETNPALRMRRCFDAAVCFKCLRLDSRVNLKDKEWGKQHRPNCTLDWLCEVDSCGGKKLYRKNHFLLCGFHSEENSASVGDFIKQLDQTQISPTVKFFTCYPTYFARADNPAPVHVQIQGYDVEPDISANSIFMVQDVELEGESFLLFYDTGCHAASISDRAARILKSTCVREGPTNLGVAGGGTVQVPYGDEQFALPLVGGKRMCLITGLRMDEITGDFPTWHIEKAWPSILTEFSTAYPNEEPPAYPASIGGKPVELMLGIRYIKHFPTLMFTLPSGLAFFQSKIPTPDGSNLVLGGPHPSWNYATKQINLHTAQIFFSREMRAYYSHHLTLTVPMLLPLHELNVDAVKPNKRGWQRAVRVMSYMCKFVRLRCKAWKPIFAPPPPPSHPYPGRLHL